MTAYMTIVNNFHGQHLLLLRVWHCMYINHVEFYMPEIMMSLGIF